MSDYVLEDRPNTCGTPQYRKPRRQPLSGCVDVHTAESIKDDVGPDTGAENVANFIVGRCDYGSYHVLVDSDSVVHMAPDDAETWHVAATAANGYGNNSHAWGISGACAATDWNPDDPWTQTVIDSMGREIAEFWMRNGFDDLARHPRWISKEEADAMQPGLILHGTHQPWDRSDAWKYHPQRSVLDEMLLDAIRRHGGGTPNPPEEEIMAGEAATILRRIDEQDATLGKWMHDTRAVLENAMGAATLKVPGDDRQWLLVATADGLRKYPIKDPTELRLLVAAQMVRQGQPGDQFSQVKELTDQADIDALNAMPVIGA